MNSNSTTPRPCAGSQGIKTRPATDALADWNIARGRHA